MNVYGIPPETVADYGDSYGVIGETVNEFGTPVSVIRCSSCERVTTVCPVTTTERWGTGCLADDCSTYDLSRDIDIFFEPMSEAGLIRRD